MAYKILKIFYFIQHWIHIYGYYALCLGLLIEGEIVLITAGVLAQKHNLYYPWVFIISFCLTLLRDQSMFSLGKISNKSFLNKLSKIQKKKKALLKKIDSHSHAIAFIYQFTYGLRYLAPFCLGISQMKRASFLIWNLFNASLWTLLFSGLGYYLGKNLFPIMNFISHFGLYLTLLLIFIIIFMAAKNYLKKNQINIVQLK